ncbi:MAG: hypothetical protein J0I17_11205 ['Candidatus Kapabacteria' thiocyanatum]|uniref:Uncharacterized protein n=1 Tax=Candidatus Kapaibacterium thiocyanatum TaxID=1895771 RepID=A0A1M3KZ74_9BACT|nr:hypothetical protein ['Candidatus Kapabacteria' thiocyanatum]OJX57680.1 MAG: hypothetical protein BGO89_06830 ['Candidatus Kapabacteria' thiocyanatum]
MAKNVRDVRISKQKQYLFGPIARGAEQADIDPGELVQFLTVSESGINYPREHDGTHFTEMGIATFAEYLNRNPEGLRPGRRFFFYEQTADGYRLVHTGTMKPPKDARSVLGDEKPHADQEPVQASGQQPQIVVHIPEDHRRPTAPRVSLEEIIDQMRDDVRSLRAENATMVGRMSELHTKIIEADQKRLVAENELVLARERHERDIEALRTEHARAIETQNALHAKDLEILGGKAIEEARIALKDESLQDDDESTFERLMDFVAPFIQPAGELAKTWLETKLHEKRVRQHLPATPVTNGPAPATNHVHESGQPAASAAAAAPQATQYPIVQDPMMMFQHVQA